MYTVIGSLRSRTLRVLWLLEELGVAYEHLPASPGSDQVRAHYSTGKVPVLLEGEHVFTDSVAIMTYLSDKHEQFTFKAGTPERAIQDGHTNFLVDEFDGILWTAARHSFVLPEEHRVPAVKDSLKWEFERSQKRLVERLGSNPFLMGEVMTIADILAVHCGGWAITAKFPVTEPVFRDYIERLRARPAFVRAMDRDG
ncbi:MAG: glutathione S-transferase [Marinosulfonomonas sp.]|nr:MAG: glutathione S-transferase [Marinosulfonomonas sp.]